MPGHSGGLTKWFKGAGWIYPDLEKAEDMLRVAESLQEAKAKEGTQNAYLLAKLDE